ncbi:MAG: enoyl-CoA hydratase/isomerase family protein [Rhodoferax sp.]|nr:enoyl-CoA hydratase/isomerase family protein [Rhodoferax sp.]
MKPTPYPDCPSLLYDRPAERVLRITMARGKMNAMDFEFHHAMTTVWQAIEDDDSVSVVILTGQGRAFSAGGDFALEQKVVDEFEWRARMWKDGRNLVRNLMHFSKPLISAINGAAAGGGLAAALLADVSIAARSAKIVDGHVRLGVAAGDHAAIIWPLLCGMAKAKYYLLSGDPLNGEEAERIGLVSMCVDDDRLQDTALQVALKLAQGSPSALRWTKLAMNNWMQLAWPIFENSLALEILGFSGPDVVEGLKAYEERRPPAFNPRSPV